MRRGFTLVECMLASAILGLATLALFEGVALATRIDQKNPDQLAAEAIAWDAVWKRFNEDFDNLVVGTNRITLGYGAAHQLMPEQGDENGISLRASYVAPVLTVAVGLADETGFSRLSLDMKKITTDVEWGPASKRRTLSEYGLCPQVFRSRLTRTNQ